MHIIHTARLILMPVTWRDLDDIAALKADAGAFGQMLGGVRSRFMTEQDMAEDIAFWGQYKAGIFTIRRHNKLLGITGFHRRPDGRGIGLRFALWPWAQGKGYAREAASAALWFGHEQGIKKIVAVTRHDNIASRTILGGIGMRLYESFIRDGQVMDVYCSKRAE